MFQSIRKYLIFEIIIIKWFDIPYVLPANLQVIEHQNNNHE